MIGVIIWNARVIIWNEGIIIWNDRSNNMKW